jgi:hypothetical protein
MQHIKSILYQFVSDQIDSKINLAHKVFDEANESVVSETKSSAGDKHETSRAMSQLEVEKAGRYLVETQRMKSILGLLEPEKEKTTCCLGALVETTQGNYYLSIAIGKTEIEKKEYFCVGMNSPLAQALLNLKEGGSYVVAGKKFEVLKVR